MNTNSSGQRVKDFYNKNPFPGPYTASQVRDYGGQNRYVSFISRNIMNSSDVLDAGCGTGFITNYLAHTYPTKHFTGVDFSDSIDHADSVREKLNRPNLRFIKQDLTNFETQEKYDTIICQGVLHHIPDYRQTLARLKNLLIEGGTFIGGLYHPWGKILQKLIPIDYNTSTLEIDQENHPFELSFSRKEVIKMFAGYMLIESTPGILFNWRNGGLTTYIFKKKKEEKCLSG